MKMKSFYIKLFATFLAVTLGSCTLLFFLFSETIREHNVDVVGDHLESVCIAAAYQLPALLEGGDSAAIDRFAKDLGRRLGVRITVVRLDGTVIGDTDHEPATMDNHLLRPEIAGATINPFGRTVRHSDTLNLDMLYVAMRFPGAEHPQAFVRVSLPLTHVNEIYKRLAGSMIPLTIGIIVVSLVICAFITRRLSRPLAEMRSVAEKVSRGEFNARVLIDRRDEIGDLAEAFNRMTAEIQALFDRLSGQKEELETVLAAISEGLALIDHDHRIIKANQTFLAQVKCPEAVGKPYWEVIRNPQFAEALRQVREAGTGRRVELALGECIFLCSFAFLPSRGGIVVLFFDISEMKRLETIKKDLVVNISHEFKTPLTAIRGFAEALEEDPTQHREYVDTIKRNADRLSAITNDLLLLARLEYKDKPLLREELDLRAVVDDTAAIFQAMLKEKNLSLTVSAEEGLSTVLGDRFMLEQVFTNLLENAIKYTEAGGIRVTLERRERYVAVAVSDTGIGIPAEHLPRIFERFYTVDKSRSRRHGGTGLGLAIVKNIVLQHGGELSVQSIPGQGTTFTFTLPVA